ncbi:MAG: phage DNA encapsidation protein [Methanobrevibacter sp.]|nr:phage DNA encapsidation protein [Methanobrevibacter sp.]
MATDIKKKHAIIRKERKAKEKAELLKQREFYYLRSILGYSWALFFFLLGGREAGKSYATTSFFVDQWRKHKRPFYWLRLSETSAKKLLNNNAEKLIDPDIRRRYNLDIITSGNNVYEITKRSKPDKDGKTKILKKELMARVFSIATFYNDKGSGLFDKDFLNDPNMFYNICLDEMNREANEKNSFDIVYSFTNQLENLIRSTKTRIRIICIGNTLEEASDLLCAMNFIPEKFGRFKLVKNKKKLVEYIRERNLAIKNQTSLAEVDAKYANIDFGKRAVIEYMEPTEAYKNRRAGTVADILMPTASTFTNEIKTDNSLVFKGRVKTPLRVIKFTKDEGDWFTLWENGCIKKYNKENKPALAMRPYLDEIYDTKLMTNIIQLFDYRSLKFKDLITFKQFQKQMNLLKPRG